MYSPPAITSGTKYDRTSASSSSNNNNPIDNNNNRTAHHHPSYEYTQQSAPHKLPSLPPFPSLVSSLGERPQEYSQLSNSQSQSVSPSSHREASSTLPPPPFYSHHLHPSQQQQQQRNPEIESATRSSWEPSETRLDHRTRTSNTTSSSVEDRKPDLLPTSAYSGGLSFRPSSQVPSNMSGQVEWESSIRTGSSASTSEAPLSPAHPNAKRRRISAAHDIVHGSPSAEDLHDDDDHPHIQIDELSHHNNNNASNTTIMMNDESASPPGGDGGGGNNSANDEKGANGRTLKQTKRAAQNRAAQQAFRKRKEERIKELEEKEKVLNSLVARENEIVRREKILAERERLAASNASLPQNGSSSASSSSAAAYHSSENKPGSGQPSATTAATAASVTATNDWDRAFANAPVASPVQHIAERLESSNRNNEALKNELEKVNKQLQDKIALVESLRRSLEDLGAENRNLRDLAVARSSNTAAQDNRGQHQQPQQQQQQHEHQHFQHHQHQQQQQHQRQQTQYRPSS